MTRATSTLIAAVAAFTLSGAAYAQNNTLATPSTVSPVAATSSYGTPGATGSDSGTRAVSANSNAQNGTSNGTTSSKPAFGGNNTLARPSVTSPVGSSN
ncbi:MAG TPA: hypothetical protein VNE00_25325 [Paraburkholderia sp.]|jgi:hypothetical protein|nr:hypothetical protein [Paraburkholderia sp.]